VPLVLASRFGLAAFFLNLMAFGTFFLCPR
jgi:hypothetical protein